MSNYFCERLTKYERELECKLRGVLGESAQHYSGSIIHFVRQNTVNIYIISKIKSEDDLYLGIHPDYELFNDTDSFFERIIITSVFT